MPHGGLCKLQVYFGEIECNMDETVVTVQNQCGILNLIHTVNKMVQCSGSQPSRYCIPLHLEFTNNEDNSNNCIQIVMRVLTLIIDRFY